MVLKQIKGVLGLSEHNINELVRRASKFLSKDYQVVRNMTVIDVVAELVHVCETQETLLEMWVKDDDES